MRKNIIDMVSNLELINCLPIIILVTIVVCIQAVKSHWLNPIDAEEYMNKFCDDIDAKLDKYRIIINLIHIIGWVALFII